MPRRKNVRASGVWFSVKRKHRIHTGFVPCLSWFRYVPRGRKMEGSRVKSREYRVAGSSGRIARLLRVASGFPAVSSRASSLTVVELLVQVDLRGDHGNRQEHDERAGRPHFLDAEERRKSDEKRNCEESAAATTNWPLMPE